MKLVSTNKFGRFVEVYTHEDPPPSIYKIAPNKSPYVIFVLESDKRNQQLLDSVPFMSRVAMPKYYDNKCALVISGRRKVVAAINEYLSLGHHSDPVNEPVKQKLIMLRNEIVKQISIPPRSKYIEKFVDESNPIGKVAKSAHAVKRVKKQSNPHGSTSFFKPNQYQKSISEIEAFNAICYRLLLNDRAAKVKSVHGDAGQRVGQVSKEVKNFSSLHDYFRAHSNNFPPQTSLVTAGYGRALAASYCEEENDLHGGNIAYDEIEQTVSRIDYDQSTWPLTSKYIGRDPNVYDTKTKCKPAESFPVTKDDIVNFPHLADAKPYNWPDRSDSKKIDLTGIENNERFKRDKYFIFLKRILISERVYQNAANATIGNENTRRKFVAHKVKRTNELKATLLQVPEFRSIVLNDPSMFSEIVKEFETYNTFYKKERDSALKVDIDDVKKSMNQLMKECKTIEEDIKKITFSAFTDFYHPEYDCQYRLPIKLFGDYKVPEFNAMNLRERTIWLIKTKLDHKGIFTSYQQAEELFNNVYGVWDKEVDKKEVMESSARKCIDKIIVELTKLDKKVGLLGGETVKFGSVSLTLPAGAASMLKYYKSNLELLNSNPTEILDTLTAMAANSAKHQNHWFFSKRLPETNDFYKWASAIVKPRPFLAPLVSVPANPVNIAMY